MKGVLSMRLLYLVLKKLFCKELSFKILNECLSHHPSMVQFYSVVVKKNVFLGFGKQGYCMHIVEKLGKT